MLIFPAIDLYEGKAVRLYKGDYEQMTVYSDSPIELVEDFVEQGAKHLHLIDLEGAKTGKTPNLELIRDIRALSPLFTQVGGGIRSMDVVDAYLGAGVDRVILGTAAVTDPVFLEEAIKEFGDKVPQDVQDMIRAKAADLKTAIDANDTEAMKTKMDDLQKAMMDMERLMSIWIKKSWMQPLLKLWAASTGRWLMVSMPLAVIP